MVEFMGATFLIGAPILFGVILSIVELYFIASDEVGMHWFQHGIHAVPLMFVATVIIFNVPAVLQIIGVGGGLAITAGIQVVIALLVSYKAKLVSSITGNGTIGESNVHVAIMVLLIFASPYIWQYGLESFLGPLLPF